MGASNYSDEFKRNAVHQILVRGYPVREASALRKTLTTDTTSPFSGVDLFGGLHGRSSGYPFGVLNRAGFVPPTTQTQMLGQARISLITGIRICMKVQKVLSNAAAMSRCQPPLGEATSG